MTMADTLFTETVAKKAARIVLMGFDVDGVLTDGTLYFTSAGDEMKAFSSLDGHGLRLLQRFGVEVAIISGRSSRALALRAENLGISSLHMGVEDKRSLMQQLVAERGLNMNQAGYMGDDIVDLPILRTCGFSATVADGHAEVIRRVDYVTGVGGGRGAVREVCDFILRVQGHWDTLMAGYLA
jgi:3-deoxy-D-manno-octulosonate 8-phosphate phosphatase (KDO 8-P phosphatase)